MNKNTCSFVFQNTFSSLWRLYSNQRNLLDLLIVIKLDLLICSYSFIIEIFSFFIFVLIFFLFIFKSCVS